jgi:hypothetical protein
MIARSVPLLLHNHKDVSAVFNPPIPFLTIPISVLVSMPVWIIPIAVFVYDCGGVSFLWFSDHRPE